jgi:parvulin-like peptidyl-prolyl isomerase
MRRFIRNGLVLSSTLVGLGVAAGQPPRPAAPAASGPTVPRPAVTTAATVNGEVIRLDEVDAYIRGKFPLGPLTAAQARQLRTEVVNDMIDDLLLKQFLRKHGPKVEPAEVDRHLKAFAESLAKKNKTLADFYRETNQTEAQVRETWAIMLQLARYVKEHVKDEQLRAYYAANKDFFDRVEVRVSHIVIRVGATATPVERAAAREKLQALRASILSGKIDFARAAEHYSQCPSAAQGGDLGFILRKGMLPDEAFCRAAFALKVGEVSGVVETDSGVHLIKATDRKPGVPSAFAKCVEEVRESFTDDYRTELIARLRKQAQIQITVP